MPFNFRQAREAVNKTRDEQIKLLEQMRDENPRYLSSLAWDVFGPPVRLGEAEGDYAELWARVKWNERAAQYIRAGEYRYCSIEVDLDHYNEKTGKHIGTAALASAITNRPFIKGMADIALGDDETEGDLMLIMTGRWHHIWYGEFSITATDLDEAVKNHNEVHRSANPDSPHPPTEMVIDYNHGSLAWEPEAAIAAGWVGDDGLFKLCPKVAASAVPQGVALSTGNKGLPIIINTPGGKGMNDAQVRRILDLSDDVTITDEHRRQAFAKLAEQDESAYQASQPDGNENTPDAEDEEDTEDGAEDSEEDKETPDSDSEEGATVSASEHANTQKRLAEVERKLAEKDVDEVLNKALNDGKITPTQKKSLRQRALSSGEGYKTVMAFVAELPANVFNTTEVGQDNGEEGGAAPGTEAAARAEFAANQEQYEKMGLSEEQFVKNAGILK